MPRRSPLAVVVLLALSCLGSRPARLRAGECSGWLLPSGVHPEDGAAVREAYVPQPGDIVFFSNNSLRQRCLYTLAYTGKPYHVGLVVRLPDGRPATLEAGPYNFVNIYLMDLLPRFRTHDGPIWVRRRCVPLDPEQSARLTEFALAQTGKRFALLRVSLEITPFRAHGPLRSRLFGSPRIDRHCWFCSELTVAALAAAGVLDPQVMKPNTIYPRDLFRDRPFDLKPSWEEPRRWSCDP